MSNNLPYDKADPRSIERYAKELVGKSLRDVLGDIVVKDNDGKGNLGNLVEEQYFMYKPNSKSEPDFAEAGVELKTTPLKKIKKGLVPKERLVLNIINYQEEHKHYFRESSFWKKNSLLLLMFYLYDEHAINIDYIFKIVRLWEFPPEDLKIIRDDWEAIVKKIREGKAHELSEGDTFYLGACTKGANKESVRSQANSDISAKQRAFSLKSKYLKYIIDTSLTNTPIRIDRQEQELVLSEPYSLVAEKLTTYRTRRKNDDAIVSSLTDYKPGETFEQLIYRRFEPYIGKTEDELFEEFGIPKTKAKNRYHILAARIMGVKGNRIEEFEKADVLMKTIRLERKGTLKESMSFAQIDYSGILEEEWEESYWFETITKRFFFVIFQKDISNRLLLKRVMFWTMPFKDLNIASQFWQDIRAKIKADDFLHFWKISDNNVFHVRPKAKNSFDRVESPNGKLEKRFCYWINAKYIQHTIG
ncbi:MAG: hypothetical protein HUU02_10900 [Bacteroidetes bacterium]|nr:hypothetical protein [Bacteroidota bacterium]